MVLLRSAENDFGVQSLDPYELPPELWVDNVSLWPPVEFPHIYVYLIDTPGEFTQEKLKAFKSLEAYNYYAKLVINQIIIPLIYNMY